MREQRRGCRARCPSPLAVTGRSDIGNDRRRGIENREHLSQCINDFPLELIRYTVHWGTYLDS
jgi:hypothetical protein